jgi:hypothetical protein
MLGNNVFCILFFLNRLNRAIQRYLRTLSKIRIIMGSMQSKRQEEMRSWLEKCSNDFIKRHCLLFENESTDATLLMEAFIMYLQKEYPDKVLKFQSECVTVAWMADIIQQLYPQMRFVGSCPRLLELPYAYKYTFKPTSVIGVRLVNFQQLWIPKPTS